MGKRKAIITRSQLSHFLTKCFVFFLLCDLIKCRYSDLYIKYFWKSLLLLIKFFFLSYSGDSIHNMLSASLHSVSFVCFPHANKIHFVFKVSLNIFLPLCHDHLDFMVVLLFFSITHAGLLTYQVQPGLYIDYTIFF